MAGDLIARQRPPPERPGDRRESGSAGLGMDLPGQWPQNLIGN
jgi:hypothetical protein